MLAVDVVANAIRANPRDIAAGTLAERYLRALHAAGYRVIKRDTEHAVSSDGEQPPCK